MDGGRPPQGSGCLATASGLPLLLAALRIDSCKKCAPTVEIENSPGRSFSQPKSAHHNYNIGQRDEMKERSGADLKQQPG